MAWKAKITGINRTLVPLGTGPGSMIAYEVTVEFYLDSDPTTKHVKKRVLPQGVTRAQVLAAIQNELSDLEAGDTIQTTIYPHIGEEIDVSTTW